MSGPASALLIGGLLIVLAAVLLWPRRGVLVRWWAALRKTERVLLEDALKQLFDEEYLGRLGSLNGLAGALGISSNRAADLVARLEAMELIAHEEGGLRLTSEGRSNALRVIRIHRLWERYLADHSGLEQTEWHERAERLEHRTSEAEAEAMAQRMGHPRFDPHGDPIPTATGEIAPRRGRPLNDLAAGERATIVHVEDEPSAVYAQLVAEGIEPLMSLRVLEVTGERIRIELDGDERVLAPVVARNISVVPIAAPEAEGPSSAEKLSGLAPGERGVVVSIARSCFGAQRRRLLDLGLVPGTEVEAEMSAPSGDPVAYRIRGATIALRREQADRVHIERVGGGLAS
jgi:DtxR family Mn-dependent transcriptional regulator